MNPNPFLSFQRFNLPFNLATPLFLPNDKAQWHGRNPKESSLRLIRGRASLGAANSWQRLLNAFEDCIQLSSGLFDPENAREVFPDQVGLSCAERVLIPGVIRKRYAPFQ